MKVIAEIVKHFKELGIELIKSEAMTTQGKINFLGVFLLGIATIILALYRIVEYGVLNILLVFGISGYLSEKLRKRGIT